MASSDPSTCPVHDVPLVEKSVPIVYGLPMPMLLEAQAERFPHAEFVLGGCTPRDEHTTQASVCPACEAAHEAWLKELGERHA